MEIIFDPDASNQLQPDCYYSGKKWYTSFLDLHKTGCTRSGGKM